MQDWQAWPIKKERTQVWTHLGRISPHIVRMAAVSHLKNKKEAKQRESIEKVKQILKFKNTLISIVNIRNLQLFINFKADIKYFV